MPYSLLPKVHTARASQCSVRPAAPAVRRAGESLLTCRIRRSTRGGNSGRTVHPRGFAVWMPYGAVWLPYGAVWLLYGAVLLQYGAVWCRMVPYGFSLNSQY